MVSLLVGPRAIQSETGRTESLLWLSTQQRSLESQSLELLDIRTDLPALSPDLSMSLLADPSYLPSTLLQKLVYKNQYGFE